MYQDTKEVLHELDHKVNILETKIEELTKEMGKIDNKSFWWDMGALVAKVSLIVGIFMIIKYFVSTLLG